MKTCPGPCRAAALPWDGGLRPTQRCVSEHPEGPGGPARGPASRGGMNSAPLASPCLSRRSRGRFPGRLRRFQKDETSVTQGGGNCQSRCRSGRGPPDAGGRPLAESTGSAPPSRCASAPPRAGYWEDPSRTGRTCALAGGRASCPGRPPSSLLTREINDSRPGTCGPVAGSVRFLNHSRKL